ncbi:MAG: globin [Parvibaculum sp.]|nr:globin [Parvibaculum sp.]
MTSHIHSEPILQSLELVAERVGDPTPLVYAELFRQQPEMEAMFVNDRDGAVRGHMLSEALDGILDFVDERKYADNMIRAEIVNHENLGVPPDVFAAFFAVIRDAFRDALGREWTKEMEEAWKELLVALSETLPAHA